MAVEALEGWKAPVTLAAVRVHWLKSDKHATQGRHSILALALLELGSMHAEPEVVCSVGIMPRRRL